MTGDATITAIVVTHRSEQVIAACLESLRKAAPARGVRIFVVDNASPDASAEIASAELGSANVLRLPENRGFAAGVNSGLRAAATPWIAVINPDTRIPAGGLDRLVEQLETRSKAAIIGPRVRDLDGRSEPTVGRFPTVRREWAHAWLLDRLLGLEGRRGAFPHRTATVDWISGCAWVMRSKAVLDIGVLDEDYFMYYEDVDYCRRAWDRGWEVLATPDVEIEHAIGHGSAGTSELPADGGPALLRYFARHDPRVPVEVVRRLLLRGWRLRTLWRRVRVALGDRASAGVIRRYAAAIRSVSPS